MAVPRLEGAVLVFLISDFFPPPFDRDLLALAIADIPATRFLVKGPEKRVACGRIARRVGKPAEAVRPQSDLVGMAEACKILGVGPGKMYEMCRNSLLPSPLKFNRKPMWPRPAVIALAARLGGSK